MSKAILHTGQQVDVYEKLTPSEVPIEEVHTIAIATGDEPESLLDILESQVQDFERQYNEQWDAPTEVVKVETLTQQEAVRPIYEHPMLKLGLIRRKG